MGWVRIFHRETARDGLFPKNIWQTVKKEESRLGRRSRAREGEGMSCEVHGKKENEKKIKQRCRLLTRLLLLWVQRTLLQSFIRGGFTVSLFTSINAE